MNVVGWLASGALVAGLFAGASLAGSPSMRAESGIDASTSASVRSEACVDSTSIRGAIDRALEMIGNATIRAELATRLANELGARTSLADAEAATHGTSGVDAAGSVAVDGRPVGEAVKEETENIDTKACAHASPDADASATTGAAAEAVTTSGSAEASAPASGSAATAASGTATTGATSGADASGPASPESSVGTSANAEAGTTASVGTDASIGAWIAGAFGLRVGN